MLRKDTNSHRMLADSTLWSKTQLHSCLIESHERWDLCHFHLKHQVVCAFVSWWYLWVATWWSFLQPKSKRLLVLVSPLIHKSDLFGWLVCVLFQLIHFYEGWHVHYMLGCRVPEFSQCDVLRLSKASFALTGKDDPPFDHHRLSSCRVLQIFKNCGSSDRTKYIDKFFYTLHNVLPIFFLGGGCHRWTYYCDTNLPIASQWADPG